MTPLSMTEEFLSLRPSEEGTGCLLLRKFLKWKKVVQNVMPFQDQMTKLLVTCLAIYDIPRLFAVLSFELVSYDL